MTFGPHVPSHGPSPARIAIVAEHPGEHESEQLKPLVGASGSELRRMLRTVGVDLNDCWKSNVFSRQPSGNNLALFGTSTPSPAARSLGPLTTNPITFLHDDWFLELDRLRAELQACAPNIILALGNTACWALGLGSGINSLRGTIHATDFIPGRRTKVLPTYHPAAVLRQWDQRVIALADLAKGVAEAEFPEFRYDNAELWLAPTIDDLHRFGAQHMEGAAICAFDVETKRGQITCVSFAPRSDVSICVPFWVEGANPHYWGSDVEEGEAWRWVRKWMEDPNLVKVMQNGLYDTQYCIKHGIRPRGCTEDTMLLHHSLYSEMKKGLGFLGSVYTSYPSWKGMRTFKKEEQLKRDD